MPQIVAGKNVALNIILSIVITLVSILVWMVSDTYTQAYLLVKYDNIDDAYDVFFGNAIGYIVVTYLLFNVYAYFNERGFTAACKNYLFKKIWC